MTSTPKLNINTKPRASNASNASREADGPSVATHHTMQLNCWLPATITVDLSGLSIAEPPSAPSAEAQQVHSPSRPRRRIIISKQPVEVPDSPSPPRSSVLLPGAGDPVEHCLNHSLSTVHEEEEHYADDEGGADNINDMVITVTRTVEVVSEAGNGSDSVSSHESIFDILHAAPVDVRPVFSRGLDPNVVTIGSTIFSPAPSRPPSPVDSHISFSVISATRSATPASPFTGRSPTPSRAPTPTTAASMQHPHIFGDPSAPVNVTSHAASRNNIQRVNGFDDNIPVFLAPPVLYSSSRAVTINDIYNVDRSDIVSRFAYDSEPEDRGFLQPWYVVIRGAQTGVFKTWSRVADAVRKVPGALYESVPTKAEALALYNRALTKGNVQRLRKYLE